MIILDGFIGALIQKDEVAIFLVQPPSIYAIKSKSSSNCFDLNTFAASLRRSLMEVGPGDLEIISTIVENYDRSSSGTWTSKRSNDLIFFDETT